MDIDFFLEVVVPKLIVSTITSILIALAIGGIFGIVVDLIRRKKARSAGLSLPPRLVFLAMLGCFIGTMLIGFLPILVDRNSLNGGAYYGLWLYIQLITLVPIGAISGVTLGCWMGASWRRKFNLRNISIALGVVYLVMSMAIYGALVQPTPHFSKSASGASNSSPIVAEISGYDDIYYFVKHMAFTPDSRSLAIGSNKDIRIFDLQSQQITKTIKVTGETLKDMVDRLAFTPNGKKLISSAPQEVQIRDLQTGEIQQRLNAGHEVYPTPDGKKLVGFSESRPYSNLLVWTVPDYKLLHTIPAKLMPWEGLSNNPVSISPDSKTVIFAPNPHDNLLQIWDLESGKQIGSFGSNAGKSITAMGIAPDGKQLFEIHNNNLYLWDLSSRKIVRTIPQVGTVIAAYYRPDGQTIVMNTEDNLQLWDLRIGKSIKTITNKVGLARYFAMSPNGKAIAAFQNNLVKIFQLP
jgi:WD40 repeat protein